MVHSVAMSIAETNLRKAKVRAAVLPSLPSKDELARPNSPPLSRLREIRECQQVAAICYRLRRGAIEFLLVKTRGTGRWTFPKGGAEPGLTHAQAAALEAFEEAGVRGRVEENAFTRYFRRLPGNGRNSGKSAAQDHAVSAHLCEVLRLCTPEETGRNRTWFSVADAKLHLRERRQEGRGNEIARVIDTAVRRINRLQTRSKLTHDYHHRVRNIARQNTHPTSDPLNWNPYRGFYGNDGLQRVQFEYPNRSGSFADARQFTVPGEKLLLQAASKREVLQFVPASPGYQHLRLPGIRNVKALANSSK